MARLNLNRFAGKEIKLIGKYLVPGKGAGVRVDLPRPIKVIDRGGKGKIKVPEEIELSAGTTGFAYPLVDNHEARVAWDTSPDSVEIAWRPFRPEFSVTGVTDVWLHDQFAEAAQHLNFTVPAGSTLAPCACGCQAPSKI